MTLLDRVARLVRANLSELLDRVEDPEKILKQALVEMKEAYRKAEEEVARVVAEENRLAREVRAYREMAGRLRERAKEALLAGKESLARESLREAVRAETLAAALEDQLADQREASRRLRQQLSALAAKIAEAEGRKRILLARKRTYQAADTLRQLDSRVLGHPAREAFQEMAERIEAMGDRQQALALLAEEQDPERKLSVLEEDRRVEEALAELRREVKG